MQPKSLHEFLIEAINEVAPGRGREIYWRGFLRYENRVAKEHRDASLRHRAGELQLTTGEESTVMTEEDIATLAKAMAAAPRESVAGEVA